MPEGDNANGGLGKAGRDASARGRRVRAAYRLANRLLTRPAASDGAASGDAGQDQPESLGTDPSTALRLGLFYKLALDEHAIVVITDARGRITYANDRFCDISKYKRSELIGRDHRLVNSGHHPKEFWTQMYRTVMAGDIWSGEVKNRAKDGSYYWVDTTIVPYSADAKGVTALIATRTDITARKAAEEATRRLSGIIEASTDVVCTFDATGQMLYANRAAIGLLQLVEGPDLKQRNIADFFDGSARAVFLGDVMPRALASGTWTGDSMFVTPLGLVPMSVQVIVHRSSDGLVEYVSTVARDITAQRRAQETSLAANRELRRAKAALEAQARQLEQLNLAAQAASEAKTQFLANMSHEIRTPMTAIVGFTDMLVDPDITTEERESCIETIRRSSDHLLSLINDVLDLSKIESGCMTLESMAVDLPDLVEGVIELMAGRAGQKSLSLGCRFTPEVPRQVMSDPTRLRQVLVNLVGNAIKFTERGGVTIAVTVVEPPEGGVPEPEDSLRLRLTVEDTGIGMNDTEVRRLFRHFSQADDTTTRRYGGTGLGLVISKRIAQHMGGDITVTSEKGVGSRFIVDVLVRRAEVATGRTETSAAGVRPVRIAGSDVGVMPVSLVGTRVLLAEDLPEISHFIATQLRRAGATVTTAENGIVVEDAVETARMAGTPFDLIIMDMQMPVQDGYVTAERLRGRDGVAPILALTAQAMAGDRERCIAAGCTHYLTKPVTASELLAAVSEIVRPGLHRADAA